MWVCDDCGRRFEHFRVLYDRVGRADGDYDDAYICPYCGSEDFGEEKNDEGRILGTADRAGEDDLTDV